MGAIVTFMFFAIIYRVYVDIKNKTDPITPILGGSLLAALMMMLASATKQYRFFTALAVAIFAGAVITGKDKSTGKNALSVFLTNASSAPDAASNVIPTIQDDSTTASPPRVSLAPPATPSTGPKYQNT